MKIRGTALAVLVLAAGTATAQSSSITIYGVIDQTVSKMDSGQSTLTFFPNTLVGRPDTWNVLAATSSRLGLRGSEDLGDGYKASFLIEHRFQPDTGTTEPRDGALTAFWNAASWVGLSGNFGEVRLGRQFVPAFYVAVATDPWSYDYNVGGAAAFTRGGNGVTTAYNAVTYRSPVAAGFSAELMIAAGERGAAAVNAPAGRAGRNTGASVQYSRGALWAGAAYNDSRQENTSTANRYWTLGGAYDFGFIRPTVSYAQGQNNVSNNPRTKTMLIGATAPLGLGRMKMVVARYDAAPGQNFNAANALLPQTLTKGEDTVKLGLGYEYYLSKRTSLHADIGTAKTQSVSRTTGIESGIKHAF